MRLMRHKVTESLLEPYHLVVESWLRAVVKSQNTLHVESCLRAKKTLLKFLESRVRGANAEKNLSGYRISQWKSL